MSQPSVPAVVCGARAARRSAPLRPLVHLLLVATPFVGAACASTPAQRPRAPTTCTETSSRAQPTTSASTAASTSASTASSEPEDQEEDEREAGNDPLIFREEDDPMPKGPSQLVYDGARRYAASKKLTDAERAKLLERIYPKFLWSTKQCGPFTGSYAGERATGNFVPSVVAAYAGSFTRAKAKQTLYVIAVGECGGTTRNDWGTMETVVFEGPFIAYRAIHASARDVVDVVDLDGDGIDELFFQGGYFGFGVGATTEWIANLENNTVKTIRNLLEVARNGCGANPDGSPGWHSTDRILIHRAGGRLYFQRKRERTRCKTPT